MFHLGDPSCQIHQTCSSPLQENVSIHYQPLRVVYGYENEKGVVGGWMDLSQTNILGATKFFVYSRGLLMVFLELEKAPTSYSTSDSRWIWYVDFYTPNSIPMSNPNHLWYAKCVESSDKDLNIELLGFSTSWQYCGLLHYPKFYEVDNRHPPWVGWVPENGLEGSLR